MNPILPFDTARDAIRSVLLQDWDPTDASRSEHASGQYDSYLRPLYDLIAAGGDEAAVVAFLHEREHETMCFPSIGTRRLVFVARKVIRAAFDETPRPPAFEGSAGPV